MGEARVGLSLLDLEADAAYTPSPARPVSLVEQRLAEAAPAVLGVHGRSDPALP